MKVAIFTARLIYGGGEKVQNWVARQLIEAGIQVAYFAPTVDEEYLQKLQKLDLFGKVEPVQYPHRIKARHPFRFTKEMRRLYREHGIDAILIFGGSFWEEWAARQMGVKVILAERSNPGWRKWPNRLLKQIQFRLGDGYVFQTCEQSQCYSKFAQNHCAIILNPIIDEFPLSSVPIRKEIVTVGRLSEVKNIPGILSAFARFRSSHPDYKLVVYGSGPQEQTIREVIAERHLEGAVEIIKNKTNIPELIEGAALFVFNSTNEGMPNALVEAMSVGLACISTDCPIYGPRALINDGENGALIPVNDDNALYNKMCEIIDNEELANKYRKNAILIREKLKQEKIAKQWIDFFKSIEKS